MNYDTFMDKISLEIKRSTGVYIIRPLAGCPQYVNRYKCGLSGRDHHSERVYTESQRPRHLQSRFVNYLSTHVDPQKVELVCFLAIPTMKLIENPYRTRHTKKTHLSLPEITEKEFHKLLKPFKDHHEWYKCDDLKLIKRCMKKTVEKLKPYLKGKSCKYYYFKADGTYKERVISPSADDDE
jgi:hypothetical protein